MTDFDRFIAEEVEKYKGIAFPVKAGIIERLFKKKTNCANLHPNPADEFCMPEIGPSYRIINEYVSKINRVGFDNIAAMDMGSITVEKIYPKGYMILNGHHRWAAYLQLKKNPISIEIVNITHKDDIEKMIKKSVHDKRVTFDLDEVIFRQDSDINIEEGLPLLLQKIYKQKIRKGVPALFQYFISQGYDIWVYSQKLYSMDYVNRLFKAYHVKISGIVTGIKRYSSVNPKIKKEIEAMLANKYQQTIHIDNDMLVIIDNNTKNFDEFMLKPESWSKDVMDIMNNINIVK